MTDKDILATHLPASWWVDCDTWEEFSRRAKARLEVLRCTSPKYLDHLGAQLSATSELKYTTRREP